MLRTLMIGMAAVAIGACAATPAPKAADTAQTNSAKAPCMATLSRTSEPACAGPGTRSYSQDQIMQTGRTNDVAGALQTLDPSVTVTH